MKCKLFILCGLALSLLHSCATPPTVIEEEKVIKDIDYSDLDNWAAHPDKDDAADRIPGSLSLAHQDDLPVDIFFIHPTTYTGKPINNLWNAPIHNEQLNENTDKSPIQYQASIFNQVGKVYAPRYQQAHIRAYYDIPQEDSARIFDIAYQDIKSAFAHYLAHENDGRPFILASHSQGTTHSIRLVKEVLDGQAIQKQMIAAYLVGMPVRKDQYDHIPPCSTPTQTGCFVSWRTFKDGYLPSDIPMGEDILVTNPLSWRSDRAYGPKESHLGAILRNFDKKIEYATDARVHPKGILWAAKPKFSGSFLFSRKNYHIGDYNFYYYNVQENAKQRVDEFLENN